MIIRDDRNDDYEDGDDDDDDDDYVSVEFFISMEHSFRMRQDLSM